MSESSSRLRRLLLALVLFGAAGLMAELVLLEHYEDPWQWAPLVVLALTLAAGAALWRRPTSRLLQIFRGLMVVSLVAGALGVILHLKGNMEFELERDPSLGGFALLWKCLRGATPALAPGALAQLGLLGLVFTHRHPALSRGHHPDPETT
jgi:hypothetical protein